MSDTASNTRNVLSHPAMPLLERVLIGCLLALSLGGAACQSSAALDEAGLLAWVRDPAHGLSHQRQEEAVTISCTYRPTDLLVAQELARMQQRASPPQVDSLRHLYAGKTYFTLGLSRNGTEFENQYVTDPALYAQFIRYLNDGICRDVALVTPSHDSISAMAASYLRHYGTTGRSTILLVFNTQHLDLSPGFHFLLLGRNLALHNQRFDFTAKALATLPKLRLETHNQ